MKHSALKSDILPRFGQEKEKGAATSRSNVPLARFAIISEGSGVFVDLGIGQARKIAPVDHAVCGSPQNADLGVSQVVEDLQIMTG